MDLELFEQASAKLLSLSTSQSDPTNSDSDYFKIGSCAHQSFPSATTYSATSSRTDTRSPSPSSTDSGIGSSKRKVSWGDVQGRRLSQAVLFKKDDEAWRVGQNEGNGPIACSPSLSPVYASTGCTLPANHEEMTAALARQAVQLESITCASPQMLL